MKAVSNVLFGLGLAAALSLTGCSTDGSNSGGTGSSGSSTGVYVLESPIVPGIASGSILEFSSTSSGSTTPSNTITGPSGTRFDFLAADASGDIYTDSSVVSPSNASSSILEYTAGSTGSATATRSFPFNTTTQIDAVNNLAVDTAGGIYLPEDSGDVAVFASSATGSVAPARYILGDSPTGGGLSTLLVANAAAVDASGNLYVIDEGTGVPNPIVVFSPTATGNVAPTRSIGGALTTMTVGSPKGIATDADGNLYVSNVVSGVSSILVFDSTASGNVVPSRILTGSATKLGCAGGLAVDAEGYLYVVSTATCGSSANPTVLRFSTTGTGNVAPVSSFTSSAWTNADAALSIAVH